MRKACRYPRPTVYKTGGVWMAAVTHGFSGNYENDLRLFVNWREAFDWTHNEVKNWDPGIRYK